MKSTIITLVLITITGIIMFNFLSKNSNDMDITAEEFKEKMKELPGVVIDVRTRDEYSQGHLVLTDENYDLLNGDFHDAVEKLDKNKTYYLYCRSGNRSGQAARIMKDNGFDSVFNIGGFEDLASSGLDTE